MISIRPYQQEAIDAVLAARERGITRQLICLPTGTGKTVAFASLAKSLNVPTLVVAHREELIHQAADKFSMVWPDASIGVVMADQNNIDCQVVIASIQTLSRGHRLAQLQNRNLQLAIVDEAHHAVSDSYRNVLKELGFLDSERNKLLLGVTATPHRGDKHPLGNLFQEVVFERSISTMIKAGYLAPVKGRRILTRTDLTTVHTRNGDFIESELAEVVNTPERNNLVVQGFFEHAKARKAIAFCVDVAHAKALARHFHDAGITAAAVYGAMDKDERRATLARFSSGHLQVLTNCNLLVEGYDESSIGCILMTRPTQSLGFYVQCIGRGTRLHPGKTDLLVLDFTDSHHDIGALASLKHAIPDAKEEAEERPVASAPQGPRERRLHIHREVIGDFDLYQQSHFAWIPVKEHWCLQLAPEVLLWLRKGQEGYHVSAEVGGQPTPLSSRELPIGYAQGVAEDWARRNPHHAAWADKDASWRNAPATEKQLDTLKKLGFDGDELTITKGDAHLLIGRSLHEKNLWKSEPATNAQRHFLRTKNIAYVDTITKGAAAKLIAEAKK